MSSKQSFLTVLGIIDLYHVFIDLKKAFGRVWYAALWATMKKYNISGNLIRLIKNLYDKATSAYLPFCPEVVKRSRHVFWRYRVNVAHTWRSVRKSTCAAPLCGDSKSVINFLWIFFLCNTEFSPFWHFRNISGHLFTWLACGFFHLRHGLLFTDCIV